MLNWSAIQWLRLAENAFTQFLPIVTRVIHTTLCGVNLGTEGKAITAWISRCSRCIMCVGVSALASKPVQKRNGGTLMPASMIVRMSGNSATHRNHLNWTGIEFSAVEFIHLSYHLPPGFADTTVAQEMRLA